MQSSEFVERCGAVHPTSGLFCTRIKNHDGNHGLDSNDSAAKAAPVERCGELGLNNASCMKPKNHTGNHGLITTPTISSSRLGPTNLVKCKSCGSDVSKAARKCPHCGQPLPGLKGPAAVISVLITLTLVGVYLSFFLGGGVEHKVANDAVDQYNIARRQGDRMQTCVAAGLVSAAYLQAKDDANYNIWKSTEKSDCIAAGISR